MWRSRLVALAMAALVAVVVGCGGSDSESDSGSSSGSDTAADSGKTIKMAALYLPNLEADAWSRAFNEGTKAAIETVGSDRVTLKDVEGVPYSNQATQITEQLFQQGNDLVLDTLAAGDLFYAACVKYPDKACNSVQALGDPPPNTTGHWFKFWESFYLYGVAAGLLTESDTLGYVASFDQPYETAQANAYLLGCRSVNPQCKVNVVFINSFNDAPKTVEAAQTLVNGGADVLATFSVTPGVVEVAERNKVWGFSQYSDQAEFGPNALVTGVLIKGAIQKEMELVLGSLLEDKPIDQGPRLYGMADGLEFAPWGPKVPADVQEKVEAAKQEIIDGKSPFVGPLRDQSGKVRLAEGEELTDEFMYEKWGWFVEGVSAN
ncbi:MAG: basic rane protein [Thermoleophilaceae bacterium]|jgi:basic membrane lipoprotein Med (substrate-binding protein (PBP1-ABC) superfamily)|nr:basic rane protein [Thermoleophilaceae bacterium]